MSAYVLAIIPAISDFQCFTNASDNASLISSLAKCVSIYLIMQQEIYLTWLREASLDTCSRVYSWS